MDIKYTAKGYVNKNNQRNNGKTTERGTDYGQWFYEMEEMKNVKIMERYKKAVGTGLAVRETTWQGAVFLHDISRSS